MKIELKKLSINLRMSEETTMFIADLFINGIHAGTVENRGFGGPDNIRAKNEIGAQLIKKAKTYCEALPKQFIHIDEFMGEPAVNLPIDMTLELYIDEIVQKEVDKKEQERIKKQIQKKCEKAICWGNLNDEVYNFRSWSIPLTEVLKHPKGIEAIKIAISQIKAKMKEGEIIFNKNIPVSIMEELQIQERANRKGQSPVTTIKV